MLPVSCVAGAAKQNPPAEITVLNLGIREDAGHLSAQWLVSSLAFVLLLRKMKREVMIFSPGALVS